jgi:hypothetical protein
MNDAPSASLESASQPSSRSNSIHRLRTPSELGELVRDSIRRGQSRPLQAPYLVGSTSARPSSGGSMSGSGCGSESASAPARSRSNSLGPNEMMLAPVTEHGELGREEARPPPRPPRRLCATPDQLLAGGGGVGSSEMGELVRGERSQSWASSSAPSATSTSYFTAGTSGSAGGGGGRGGDTGVGPGGGLR